MQIRQDALRRAAAYEKESRRPRSSAAQGFLYSQSTSTCRTACFSSATNELSCSVVAENLSGVSLPPGCRVVSVTT